MARMSDVPDPSASEDAVETTVMHPKRRRLQRSRDDRVIAGVCGGVGQYFGVDAVLVRIAAIVLVFAGGAGIVLYVLGWIAMPEAPETDEAGEEHVREAPAAERSPGGVVLGLVLVALGALFLVDEIWADFLAWKYIWPLALIAVGAAILVRTRQ
jgi:phage shock protein C